jgi:hypothetical protein
MYGVAYLLEFYERESLHDFFHACDDQEVDIGSAFLCLAGQVKRAVGANGQPPDFIDAAESVAKAGGWRFADYASREARGLPGPSDVVPTGR